MNDIDQREDWILFFMGLTFHLGIHGGPHKINRVCLCVCVCVCVAGPLHAEYLGCDALHQNVLDCWTGWNRLVQINQV